MSRRQKGQTLPESWTFTTLGEVCQKPQYGYTSKASSKGKTKLLRTTDITAGAIRWGDVPYCSSEPEKPEKYLLRSNDIVVSRAGSVGFSYLVKNPPRAVFASYLIRFLPYIDPEYVRYYLTSPMYWDAISEHKMGIAVPNVNATKLSKIEIPVAPTNEQRRIVTKIEELFSELDQGVNSLKTARAQLKTYRQSLLKAAFEGKLTEQWREESAGDLESGEQLLERIRAEREALYFEKLEAWEADSLREKQVIHGRKPSKPKPPQLPTHPVPFTYAANGDWGRYCHWTSLSAIADVSGGITKNQKRTSFDLEKPFLRVGNVYANELRLDDIHTIGLKEQEIHRVTLKTGDLLIVEGNGSVDQLGRVAVWNGAISECVHQNHLIKARVAPQVNAKYVMWFLLSEVGKESIKKVASSTSGLHTLSLSKVGKLNVPLCNYAEQNEIVSLIEQSVSRADAMEASIVQAIEQGESLRQSILKRAFEGKLVPQDPNDEPASELLERIRQEQGEKPAPVRRKRRKQESTADLFDGND